MISNLKLSPQSNPKQIEIIEDFDNLQVALKGYRTDVHTIIDILTNRSNSQRQEIAKYFNECLGKDLSKILKRKLGGKCADVLVGLIMPPERFLCKQLRKAMIGLGSDARTLEEILCTKSNEEIKKLNDVYEDSKTVFPSIKHNIIFIVVVYKRQLTEHLSRVTSGHFRQYLTIITRCERDENCLVYPENVNPQAEALHSYIDEQNFNHFLVCSSFAQMKLVFDEYKKISGQMIEQAVKKEFGGGMLEPLMTISMNDQTPK